MKSEELRAIQTPLKEKYKETLAAALIALKAQGRIGEGVTCEIETGKAMVEAGLHAGTGGTVRAEGEIDFRGTLGVSKDAPVGFQNLRLFFDLDTDASEEQLTSLKKLTERYCIVFQTLQQSPSIETAYLTGPA